MKTLNILFLLLLTSFAYGQDPEFDLTVAEVEAQLRFLASDDLQGRRTGEPGNNIAAKYIAEAFRSFGVEAPEGHEDYLQPIHFEKGISPSEGKVTWGNDVYQHMEDMIVLSGGALNQEARAIFVGHGLEDDSKGWNDYKGVKAKGNIMIAMGGVPDSKDPMETFQAMEAKRALAKSKGAIALIELYRQPFPWDFFKNYMTSDRLTAKDKKTEEDDSNFTYIWLKEKNEQAALDLKKGKVTVSIEHTGVAKSTVSSQNVVGIIPGTDPALSTEYIVLTAHYDHVGTGKNGGSFFTPEDSIFNGARDNAMGTVAILSAAKSLAAKPASRPYILVAFTGEEMGLLGSQYYVNQPVVPLKQCIYNFNTDGAGYNDKSSISVIGYGRTGIDDAIQAGAKSVNLGVIENPVPEQGLFDRSDNVSFAAKGVPCANFSPGVSGFDDELMKYYHQAADNPETVDMDYLLKYAQAYVQISRIIGNAPVKPKWKEGDKYEAAGKALYEN